MVPSNQSNLKCVPLSKRRMKNGVHGTMQIHAYQSKNSVHILLMLCHVKKGPIFKSVPEVYDLF